MRQSAKFFFVCLLILLFLGGRVCFASVSGIRVSALTNIKTTNADKPISVLVKIMPRNGWHIYWENPGDTGTPTKVNITSDFGREILQRQSAPKHFYLHQFITQYAYDDDAYWLFEIQPNRKKNFKLGETVSIDIHASWLACRDECVEESFAKTLQIPVENVRQLNPHWENELFHAQKTFPAGDAKGTFFVQGKILKIRIDGFEKAPKNLIFVPIVRDLLVNNHPAVFNVENNHLMISVLLREDVQLPKELDALLLTDKGPWQLHLLKQSSFFSPDNNSLIIIMLMAFMGGLLLNLMPCIFPILFLKAISLLNTTYSPQKRGIDALFYFLGIVLSFACIAGLLWILRRSGETIGWGFQLQSPVFIAVLFVLFFIIGLMFLGCFHFNSKFFNRLGTLSVRYGALDSFLTGLFAVLIASPCSAPFMGVAIGYSITQPLSSYFPIFMALAVGYALPFTLLGLFPQTLAKILPRPGKWMDTLKKIFAIPVFLTCIWLGWIFYNQTTAMPIQEKNIWQPFSEQVLSDLRRQNKPVFVDFTAKWCLTCLVNEKTALSSQSFYNLVHDKNITLLKADWTTHNEEITKALEKYNRNSVPLYVYFDDTSATPVILPQLLTNSVLEKYLQ